VRIVHLLIGGDAAGGQVVALQLARAARARGDDVELVVPAPGPLSTDAAREGLTHHVADVNRLHRAGGAARLRRIVRGADVLHTHTLASANVVARLVGRSAGVAVLSHLHIENHFRPSTEPVLRRLDNSTARLARLVAVSEHTRRAYERQGYPADRIEVVYNGVDEPPAAHAGVRDELGIPTGAPLIGEIGRLCDVKGQGDLISALADVPDARLVLVGEDLEQGGAFRAKLERDAEAIGVRDRVVFTGYRPDARALVAELDVLALPSRTEGLPLVVLEAMASARPEVATPVGGTPELVADGETGVRVPPRDPAALAAALRRLLADSELRRRLGEAGERRVRERFTLEAMCTRVLAIYDELAA
jgi:glycosyltransferase involved in cell wall biosynthesis